MSFRTIIIGLLALTFGGSAAVGVNMLYKQGSAPPPTEDIAVVVASRDIPRGALVSADWVEIREFPRALVPEGGFTTIEESTERVAVNSIIKDEPILERKLSAKHAKGGLASLVKMGMRAFTIQTPHVATHVAGFILPGNKVDILLTMNGGGPNDTTGGGVTTTLLQNVEVLAVDQRLDAPAENKVDPRGLQSVTLLVTPDQAAQLDLGQNKGTLHLSLRNPGDALAAKANPATMSGLMFHQEKPWSEQAKEVIEALAKLKNRPSEKEPTKADESAPDLSPPVPLEIRTLRGTTSGSVPIEPVRPRDR